LCHWVEEPDLWEFDGEVGEEDEHSAVPLLFRGRDFVLRITSVCHSLVYRLLLDFVVYARSESCTC
jgi:hypothetical protein